jgi:hypothetical protein
MLALIVIASALMTSLESVTAASAQASATTMNSAHLIINGKPYDLAWGQNIVQPTRLPDGSKGWIRFRADLTIVQPNHKVGQVSSDDPCQTASGTETWTDYAGFTLISYSLYQYWCYDYTHVTSYTTAYEHSSEYLGWSLANHSEWTNYFPDWFPDEGIGTGQFRFNGPFGVGCKSGSIAIDFFGDGSHPVFKYYGGYYGC